MDSSIVDRIAQNPSFKKLVAARTRFAWIMSAAVFCIYFGFILLVAFAKGFLATRIGDGVTTIGIPVGVGVIVSAFLLTGLYVRRANSEFDALTRKVVEEVR